MKIKNAILFLLASFFVFSCASSNTEITTSWKSDQPRKPSYHTIFIAVLAPDMEARTTLENELAFQAKQRGLKAVISTNVIPGPLTKENLLSRERLLEVIKGEKADAVFAVSLQNKETATRYIPGTTSYYSPMGYGYYGNFYNYYSTVYPMYYEPGYYETDRTYYLESNLYDTESEALIWSAQSTTYSPKDAEDFVKGYTQTLMQQLVKDGIAKPENAK